MHRRFASHLPSHFQQAFARAHIAVPGSRTQGLRNFSVAVEVSSDASEIKKSQRRISKDERRTLVEAFVNKYRAMNSGKFPAAKTVQKEVGGGYYLIRNLVQELQHKSRMPSTSTRNDTKAKLHENADVNLGTTVACKNSELATKGEDGPTSALAEKTLLYEIATMSTMTSEKSVSLKKKKLRNPEEDGPTSALDEKTLSDEIPMTTLGTTIEVKKVELAALEVGEPTSALDEKTSLDEIPTTLGTTVEVKKVELAALEVGEPISALDYNTFSEEIAKPSVTDDSSVETANERYLLKEEAKDTYSKTRLSEDNIREKTASEVDLQQQSSDLESFARDLAEEHEKKPLKWSLKSLADGFMKIWRNL